ncbi:MAG: hypothetical protein ACKVID_02350 [Gammaproteobacteria bacterium]|jgi:hypothetical protein|tara:strand:- start:403 stop:615 length:213 start_codon:yes stop_codon:yes gene_type:complete
MNDDQNSTIEHLLQKVKQLLNRFDEQKGILLAYVQKEREWKKHKLLQMNQIVELEKKLKKLAKAQGSNEQ